ncbi:unnamed protein product [Hydatigera taeniaeformis]|uniref:Uncharacterized protein n=1 Tax=Hydatigena taeniaeformis TaxID=6205 RepID=A0A3P7F7I6_HYDTA|nr:unnamed protein product [Hydatigera taeniaeformis]
MEEEDRTIAKLSSGMNSCLHRAQNQFVQPNEIHDIRETEAVLSQVNPFLAMTVFQRGIIDFYNLSLVKPLFSYKIATSITLSRQNAVRIEELQTNLTAKDMQIAHLKSVIAKSNCILRRFTGTGEEPKNGNTICTNPIDRFPNNILRTFRQSLADSLSESGWVCESLEEGEIIDVVRRVLATLTSQTEVSCEPLTVQPQISSLKKDPLATCCSLQSQVTELVGRVAASERRFEEMVEEGSKSQTKRSQSPLKTVEFLPCATDLENSHGQFLKELEYRIPVSQAVFEEMDVTKQRDFILNYIEQLGTPSPAKPESELAPKLHKRMQRLQDELASRDLQLRAWRRKVEGLEEQLAIAKKNEAEATEKRVFTEQRAAQLRKNEVEANKLKTEVLQLRMQLKDSKDVKSRLEAETTRVARLEESLRDLEEIRQRQINQIEELTTTLETEKVAMTRNPIQQAQRVHFDVDASQTLEDSLKEAQEARRLYPFSCIYAVTESETGSEMPYSCGRALVEPHKSTVLLRDFRDIVGRLLGMRVKDLPEPNKDILHGLERLLRESGRNALNQSTPPCTRSAPPRRALHGFSARMGFTHGDDSESQASERKSGPMQHTEISNARSSLRTSAPIRCPSSSLLNTIFTSCGHQQPPARDTRRY